VGAKGTTELLELPLSSELVEQDNKNVKVKTERKNFISFIFFYFKTNVIVTF
jgi:hypothetical protein